MNVTLISTFPPRRCGIGDYTADLARALALRNGIRVQVLTYPDVVSWDIASYDGIEVCRKLETGIGPRQMSSLLQSLQPDLIHFQSSSFLHHSSLNASVARGCDGPLVTTVHDTPRSWRVLYTIPSLRKVYQRSCRLITHSRGVSTILSEFHGIQDDKIVKIPHGVDTKTFHSGANGNEVRRRHGLEGKRIVLFFGFLRPGKGLETLLAAWNRIEDVNRDAVLVIAGGIQTHTKRYALLLGKESSYPKKLRDLAYRLNIGMRILFTGYVPEELVPGLLAAAEVVVLPYEECYSQSGPLHKALSCGRAVIATRVSGFEELLEDGRNAILVPPSDAESLAQSLNLLLSDSTLSRELGRRARALAEECLSWSQVAQRTLQIYSKLYNALG